MMMLLQKLVHFMPTNIFKCDREFDCNLKCPLFFHITILISLWC